MLLSVRVVLCTVSVDKIPSHQGLPTAIFNNKKKSPNYNIGVFKHHPFLRYLFRTKLRIPERVRVVWTKSARLSMLTAAVLMPFVVWLDLFTLLVVSNFCSRRSLCGSVIRDSASERDCMPIKLNFPPDKSFQCMSRWLSCSQRLLWRSHHEEACVEAVRFCPKFRKMRSWLFCFNLVSSSADVACSGLTTNQSLL
jgi:hypothetical protein